MKKIEKSIFIGLACLSLLLTSHHVFSQKPSKLIKKGKEFFYTQEFEPALTYFQEALDAAPENAEALLFAGAAMQFLGMEEKGLDYVFSASESQAAEISDFYYWKAYVLYRNSLFDQAAETIEKQLSQNRSTLLEASRELKQSIELAQYLYNKPSDAYIENLGQVINTKNPEYSAILTADHRTINFTSKRAGNKGGRVVDGFREDILVSSLDEEDHWATPHRLAGLVTNKNDASVQLFGNDKAMIIYQDGDLYVSKWTGEKWTNLKSLSGQINHPKSREAHAFIAKSGDIMIYSSDRNTENGDLDLFMARKSANGNWERGKPISELNTPRDEDSPFIAENRTLYFSSKGHNSMGGYDIFKSEYDATNQRYLPPVNMGYPINSVGNDIFFNLKNKIAYFTSDRPGGFGSSDIYRAYMFREVSLSGTVYSQKDKIPAKGVDIQFISESNKEHRVTTDENGNYQLDVPFFEVYTANLYYDGEQKLTETFKPPVSLRNPGIARKDFIINIPIKKVTLTIDKPNLGQEATQIIKADKIRGVVYDKQSGSPLAATIKMVDPKDGNVIEEQVLSADGKFSFQINSAYEHVAFQAHHAGYFSGEQEWKRVLHKGEEFKIGLASAAKGERLTTNRIHFDFNKASIREESSAELLKIVEFFKANPDKKVEIGGHTDNVGSETYNQSLSERRAASVKQFLVEHGIDQANMTTVGYGESDPIASNDDEENGRELNRRIEFKILE